jgi:3-oxoacyl-[acyl-carrier protein] reductase
VLILQNIKIRENGYVFLISSFYIKEPNIKLIPSNSLRIGFVSVFKSLSKLNMVKKISFINIAPGPTETDRLKELVKKDGKTMEEFVNSLPSKRVSDPSEIGKFVRFVVENKIKALNGVTINFDMGLSNYVL